MNKLHDADTVKFSAEVDYLVKHFGPSPPPVSVACGALSHPGRVQIGRAHV